ncbi:hypothetical protein PGTUg99_009401 [Puccinia graminis f. sp. tritici]|uniref:Uncharacterized protein n=1 Tax=Puccinia graminis f. sp. tritici TaxID=56615 RepID=A0A5B0LMV3_PUCGR|nr:hypothetical protein PGTUg99_009401 [Puccinia graminis f. sp. tritici]
MKNHERWIKHKERVRASLALGPRPGVMQGVWETGQVDDTPAPTLSAVGIRQADILARLDGGFVDDRYENNLDWRSNDGEEGDEEIERDDGPTGAVNYDDRFSDVSLDGLAELIRSLRQSSPVGSDFSSAAPSVWGVGSDDDNFLAVGGDRALELVDEDEGRQIADRGWFPFRAQSVSSPLPRGM